MLGINLKRASHASLLLLFFTVVKSLLSVFVRSSIAKFYGAGIESDAYFAAFTVPQQLGDFLIGGILFIIIIPVFQQRKEEVGEEESKKDVAAILHLSALGLSIVTLIYYFIIPLIIPKLFPGFSGKILELTIYLSKCFSPAIFLMGMSLICIAFYHSYRDFLVPLLVNLFFPISSLVALWLVPGFGIKGLVFCNIAACFAGFVILIIFIYAKITWKCCWSISNSLFIRIIKLSWPLLLVNSFSIIIPFIQKSTASQMPYLGAITLWSYALFIVNSALVFIAHPVSTAIFPLLGEHYAKGKYDLLSESFNQALKVMLFLSVPCFVLFLALSQDMITLFLGYGKLADNNEAKLICSQLVFIMSFIIIPNCFIIIASKMLFVLQATKSMSAVGAIVTCFAVPCYIFLAKSFGMVGVGIAFSGTGLALSIGYTILLKIKMKDISLFSVFKGLLLYLIAGVGMFVVIYALQFLCDITFTLGRFLVFSAVGGFVYIIITYYLKVSELTFILKRIPFIGDWR